MNEQTAQTVRKAYKYKLQPTSNQKRMLEETLWLWRQLYNAALEERITACRRCGVTLSCTQQQAKLPDLKAACTEYAAIDSQVVQEVVTRLDRTYQAFFRPIKGGQTPGFPRFQSQNRYHSFTDKQFGKGASLDNDLLILPKIVRIALRLSRALQGTPKTVTLSCEADGWYAIISCAEVSMQPLPECEQETGIDLRLESFASLANGIMIHHPRCYRRAERRLKTAQRTVSRRKMGSRREAAKLLAKAHQGVKRQHQDLLHKTAISCANSILSTTKRCRSPPCRRIITSSRASGMQAGVDSSPSSPSKQHTLGAKF